MNKTNHKMGCYDPLFQRKKKNMCIWGEMRKDIHQNVINDYYFWVIRFMVRFSFPPFYLVIFSCFL